MQRRHLPLTAILTVLCVNTASQGLIGQDDPSPVTPERRMVESQVLGCRIELPADGTASILGQNQDGFIRLLQRDADPPAWEIVIRPIRYPLQQQEFGSNGPPTPAAMRELFIADVKRLNDLLGVDSRTDDLTVAGLPAASATASFQHESGRYARFQWHFIQTSADRFIMLQALADRDAWPGDLFDRARESLEVLTEPELAIKNLATTDQGSAIMADVDEAVLRETLRRLEDGHWYRLSRIGTDEGERELGYARVTALETTSGVVSQIDPPSTSDGPDTGLLIWIQIHTVPQSERAVTQDIDLRAWLSWDRESERWNVRETSRAPKVDITRTSLIAGLRPRPSTKEPRRWLEVFSQARESFERQSVRRDVPQDLDLFLSEAERLVLPTILDILKLDPVEFGVWAWNEDRETITRRLESWTPTTGGGGRLDSRSVADGVASMQLVGSDGVLTRRVTIGGNWDLIDPLKLRSLYRRKGIPFGR